MLEAVTFYDPIDHLRTILSGDTDIERSQHRLEEVREQWNGSDQDLNTALIQLVENGEISLFPLNDVTKIRAETISEN